MLKRTVERIRLLGKQLPTTGAHPLPLATATCRALPRIDKDPNPYEMMAMTRQERRHYEKGYKRVNRKLLHKVFYNMTFVLWPWWLRRKKRRTSLWKRRGRHYERFRQHRLRRRHRRHQIRLSTPEKESKFQRCCLPVFRKLGKFLKKLCSCGSSQ